MTERYCRCCGGWHVLERPWPHNCLPEAPRRSALPAPQVIRDDMPAAEHPLTGKMMESKSAFERVTRSHGYVTMGDDPARLRPKPRPKPDRAKIRQSIEKAVARVNA